MYVFEIEKFIFNNIGAWSGLFINCYICV